MPDFPTQRALGLDFFRGTPAEAVAAISARGGLLVAPAAPSIIALQRDADYRRAILDADLVIADSGWMVVFWQILKRERLTRISGLALFRALLATPDARQPGKVFWIVPSENGRAKAIEYARRDDLPLTSHDCYVAPKYAMPEERDRRSEMTGQMPAPVGRGLPPAGNAGEQPGMVALERSRGGLRDAALLTILEQRQPRHIVIAIGGGMQDKLGSWLKHHLSYRPAIYCLGAAPGFVTGDQVRIPMWADRLYLGWLFRVSSQPGTYLARYWQGRRLFGIILKYGREMPPKELQTNHG